MHPITLPELKEFIDTLPGEPDEWMPFTDAGDNTVLRFFRSDPDDSVSIGWTRAWINLLTGERDVSHEPPIEAVGCVYDDELFPVKAGVTHD